MAIHKHWPRLYISRGAVSWPESCSWHHYLWHQHRPQPAAGCQTYFGYKVLVSPMSSNQSHTACPDTQPHSPADLHTLRSHVEQHFQELALHWHLSEYAGHFRHIQIQDSHLSLSSLLGVKVCFPRLYGTVSLVKICLKRKSGEKEKQIRTKRVLKDKCLKTCEQ